MNQPASIRTANGRPLFAFLAAIPIALLGGLIGLGGAEFRLPVLAGPLRYAAKQAVPLNLAISLITLGTALVSRAGSIDFAVLGSLAPAIVAMIAGALLTAVLGPSLASRISNAASRSANGGRTWAKTAYTGSAFAVATSFDGQTVALVSRETDFFRSSDGGVSWPGPG